MESGQSSTHAISVEIEIVRFCEVAVLQKVELLRTSGLSYCA